MKPKSSSTIMSAFAVFKHNRVAKKKELTPKVAKGNTLTPTQVKALENSAIITKKVKRLNGPSTSTTPKTEKKLKVQKSSDGSECGNPEALKVFTWLVHPVPVEEFLRDIFEKKPHVAKRDNNYYKGIFSCSDFDKMLRMNHLEFKTNIDVVSYIHGERQTHNPDGRAYASVVWDYYQNGCSIRLLNPQTYSKPIWKVCSLLTEYFGSFCGANMYLTPPGSQGFAPHYDDIEAFVIQLEGQKIWKVYPPRFPFEELPRYSSPNFKQDEIGDPVLEVTLNPGDYLYMPRGYIHQACTSADHHSLHITISAHQKHTWGDFLQKVLPKALEDATKDNIEYRRSLPLNYMDHVGLVNTEKDEDSREFFMRQLIRLTKGLVNYLCPDSAADLMAKDFIHSSLPPSLSQDEKAKSIHGNGEYWENGKVCNSVELDPDTEVRFIRKRSVRLIREDDSTRLYHSFENSRVYKEREAQYIEIDWELVPAVELLLETCPEYTKIEDFPLNSLEEKIKDPMKLALVNTTTVHLLLYSISVCKMDVASLLYDKGLLETKLPLTVHDEDEC